MKYMLLVFIQRWIRVDLLLLLIGVVLVTGFTPQENSVPGTCFLSKPSAFEVAAQSQICMDISDKHASSWLWPIVLNAPYVDCPTGDCDEVKTPERGTISIPSGSAGFINSAGGVYSFTSQSTQFFWDARDGNYYDIHRNQYSETSKIATGKYFPRYFQAAIAEYNTPKWNLPGAFIMHDPEEGWARVAIKEGTGYTRSRNIHYAKDYPEISTGESFIPIWGSAKLALFNFQDGYLGWGIFNSVVLVSDVFLVKFIVRGVGQGGIKALWKGNQPWSGGSNWFDPATNYSRFYHTSGFAGKNVPIHHAFLRRSQGIGEYFPNFIKNQMWNLKPITGKTIGGVFYDGWAIHRAIHNSSKILQLNALQRVYYGMPGYVYPLSGSIFGRISISLRSRKKAESY